MQGISRDIESLVIELQGFRGGVADTSTLIYLERLGLLRIAARCFPLLIIPQVAAEYGALPEGTRPLPAVPSGAADAVLCQMAQRLGQPVLSEDKRILRAAREGDLPFYNTLMIVLALCIQGQLTRASFPAIRRNLLSFAHYSPRVVAVGDAVFQALRPSRTEAGEGDPVGAFGPQQGAEPSPRRPVSGHRNRRVPGTSSSVRARRQGRPPNRRVRG